MVDIPVLVVDDSADVEWGVGCLNGPMIDALRVTVSGSVNVRVDGQKTVVGTTTGSTMLVVTLGALVEGVGRMVVALTVSVTAAGVGSSVTVDRLVVASVVVSAVVTVTVGGGEYVTIDTEMEVTVDVTVDMLTLVAIETVVTVDMSVEMSVEPAVVAVVVVSVGIDVEALFKPEEWSWPRARSTPIGTKIATRSAKTHSNIPAIEPQQARR